jgi:hypothetical protein
MKPMDADGRDRGETLVMGEARDQSTYAIIETAMEVHGQLGNGFLEAVYHDALEIELGLRAIPSRREVELPVVYSPTPTRGFSSSGGTKTRLELDDSRGICTYSGEGGARESIESVFASCRPF